MVAAADLERVWICVCFRLEREERRFVVSVCVFCGWVLYYLGLVSRILIFWSGVDIDNLLGGSCIIGMVLIRIGLIYHVKILNGAVTDIRLNFR